jgi:hypothetical protein
MKKRVVLIVLLIAVTAGMAFAQNGRNIPFNAMPKNAGAGWNLKGDWRSKIDVTSVTQTLVGINVTYKCGDVNTDVLFEFTVYYSDGTPPKTWSDLEKIRGARNSSTWRFGVLNCYHISRVDITWQ